MRQRVNSAVKSRDFGVAGSDTHKVIHSVGGNHAEVIELLAAGGISGRRVLGGRLGEVLRDRDERQAGEAIIRPV